MLRVLLLIVSLLPMPALAALHTINYQVAPPALSYDGSGAVVVLVQDARPYVVSGDKSGDFVGLVRGGFGNPFDVGTKSKRAFAEVIGNGVAASLSAAGFNAKAQVGAAADSPSALAIAAGNAGASRILVVQLREWKSDSYVKTKFSSEVVITVFDASGVALASFDDKDDRTLKASNGFGTGKTFIELQAIYKERMQAWLEAPQVRDALLVPATTPAN